MLYNIFKKMGNKESNQNIIKQNFINYLNNFDSENRFPKKIKNRILKRNVRKSDLTKKELEILSIIKKPEEAYICGYCPGFPLILLSFEEETRKWSPHKKMVTLTLLDHSWNKNKLKDYISYKFEDNQLSTAFNIYHRNYIEKFKMKELFKDEYINNFPDDFLPFENMDDFHEYLNVVIKYKNLKEKLSFYNLGDTKRNKVFTFFEFILNLGLYGFGTLYEYLNSLALKDFLSFDILAQYNCGQPMKNGKLIYELAHYEFKQIKKVVKLNDNNLIALLIDVKYRFSNYKDNIVGIILKTIDTENKYFSSIPFLMHKETDESKKCIIIKHNNDNYNNILELDNDKYLLQVDNYNINCNLIIASLIYDKNIYDYNILKNKICITFLKLKNKKIFLVCKSNIYLMIYENNELNILKEYFYTMIIIIYAMNY